MCTLYNTLLILDEIQTGLGRPARCLPVSMKAMVPDVLVLSKSLGGGVVPIGGYITAEL